MIKQMSRYKFRINNLIVGLIFVLGYVVFDILKYWDSFIAGLFLQNPGF